MRSPSQPWLIPVFIALGVAGVFAALSHIGIGILSALFCELSVRPRNLWSGAVFVFTGEPADAGVPEACASSVHVGTIVFVVVSVLALSVAAMIGYRRWMMWQQSEKKFKQDLRRREGLAGRKEIQAKLSDKARLQSARTVRPTLVDPAPKDVGIKVGESQGVDVYLSVEDSVCMEGAPRSGKGFRLIIGAIIDWMGPLITTSTRNDNLSATMGMREKVGTVTVFDPQGLSGISDSMRISPISGCEEPLTAMQRAGAIMGGTSLGSSSSNAEWAQEAEVILSRLLLAAAVSGRDVSSLRDWGASPALARPAVSILRNDGPTGWADALETVLDGDPKLLQSRWMGVSSALAPLQLPSVAAAMTPKPGEQLFDADEFLAGQNTLYLIGTRSGAGASGGFLGAVLDDIVERARRKALSSPGSRLDPPLGLILDELANLFSWKALPTILSDGGGIGIWTLVVLQALSQAETAWSAAEAETIWSSSIAKILLGGASNMGHLRDVEAMLGDRKLRTTSKTSSWGQNSSFNESEERRPVISADELRRLPTGLGLLAYKNARGVLLDMPGWIDRPDARQIQEAKKIVEQRQASNFVAPGTVIA